MPDDLPGRGSITLDDFPHWLTGWGSASVKCGTDHELSVPLASPVPIGFLLVLLVVAALVHVLSAALIALLRPSALLALLAALTASIGAALTASVGAALTLIALLSLVLIRHGHSFDRRPAVAGGKSNSRAPWRASPFDLHRLRDIVFDVPVYVALRRAGNDNGRCEISQLNIFAAHASCAE